MTTPTWFGRLLCRLFGHRWQQQGHGGPPSSQVCPRCGRWERKVEWTEEMAAAELVAMRHDRQWKREKAEQPE